MGDAMQYWQFFPVAAHDGLPWGCIPVWGFGDVVQPQLDELAAFKVAEQPTLLSGRPRAKGAA